MRSSLLRLVRQAKLQCTKGMNKVATRRVVIRNDLLQEPVYVIFCFVHCIFFLYKTFPLSLTSRMELKKVKISGSQVSWWHRPVSLEPAAPYSNLNAFQPETTARIKGGTWRTRQPIIDQATESAGTCLPDYFVAWEEKGSLTRLASLGPRPFVRLTETHVSVVAHALSSSSQPSLGRPVELPLEVMHGANGQRSQVDSWLWYRVALCLHRRIMKESFSGPRGTSASVSIPRGTTSRDGKGERKDTLCCCWKG